LSTKKAEFGEDEHKVRGVLVDASKQKQKYEDLTAIKKGINYHGANTAQLKAENHEIFVENEAMEREISLKATAGKGKKKEEEEKEAAAAEGGGTANAADQEGKLKTSDVQNLPDDADAIVKTLKALDFAKQDLDILIELSKQLKFKRLGLFPDTNYMTSLSNAGLTPDKVQRQGNL